MKSEKHVNNLDTGLCASTPTDGIGMCTFFYLFGFFLWRLAPLPPPLPRQLYRVGTYMFGKRHKSNHEFFSCDADSIETPPSDYLDSPMGVVRVHPGKQESVAPITGVRQGYMMCTILRSMNAALAAFKNRYCIPEEVSGGVKRLTDLSPVQVEQDIYGINVRR